MLRRVAAIASVWLMASAAPLSAPGQILAQTDKPELLFKEDFEAPFVNDTFCAAGQCKVPPGWEVWWVPRRETDPEGINFQPSADRVSAPGKFKTGTGAQRLYVERATFTGGIRRVVARVRPGARIRFTAAAQVWSTNDEQSFSARPSSDIKVRLGIESLVGDVSTASAFNPGVVWSQEADARDKFVTLSVEAEAKTNTIVLYTYATMRDPVRHNEVYFDDVLVEYVAVPATPDLARSLAQPGLAAAAPVTTGVVLTGTNAPAAATPAATPTPAPTAVQNASGKTYRVQSGDTVSGIAAKFGVTVDELRRLNGLRTDLLSVGQELLLEAPPTALPPTPRPPAPGTPAVVSTPGPQFGLLCVEAFYDNNGDGRRQAEAGEGLVPNVFFSISAAGQLVSTRMTDGINEPFCVQNLAVGSYVVGATTLQNYNATTPLNDTKVVQGGSAATFSIGLRRLDAGNKVVAPSQAGASAPARAFGDMALPLLAVGLGALLVVGGVLFGISYFVRQRRI